MKSPTLDIPEFLIIPQEERNAIWQKHRAPAKPSAHTMPELKRIPTPPGAKDDETDPDT